MNELIVGNDFNDFQIIGTTLSYISVIMATENRTPQNIVS